MRKKSIRSHFRRSGFERRRYVRVRSQSLVRCMQVNEELKDWLSNLKNISLGGLKMLCSEKVRPNDIVQLKINFASLDMTITIAAKAVWVTKPSEQTYEAGFSFLELPAIDRLTLQRYITTHLASQV